MTRDFEGDLLLIDTPDGGDIVIKDGLFANDSSYGAAVYLSLFGGNKEDAGKVKNNNTWWGNLLAGMSEPEKMISRFQAATTGTPMTSKTVREAENAAKLDLQWIVDGGWADAIAVDGRVSMRNRFSLRVEITARGKAVFENVFADAWGEFGKTE
jgi:phage gp46-like protein